MSNLIIVAVLAVCLYAATAQTTLVSVAPVCNGMNVTVNPANTTDICPFGYYTDSTSSGSGPYQGRCLTFRQLVNNYLYAPCNLASDCGSGYMTCGTNKKCSWERTRAVGDACEVNSNCYQYSGRYGCDKTSKTCRNMTMSYVATLGDHCNYEDMADIIMCTKPSLRCNSTIPGVIGKCQQLIALGQPCDTAIFNCVDGAICGFGNTPNRTCILPRSVNEACSTSDECSQSPSKLYCNNHKRCTTYNQAYQACNGTVFCDPTTTACKNVNGTLMCVPGAYSNETCVSGISGSDGCAPGLKCLTTLNKCFAGNITDPCEILSGGNDTCKTGLVCQEGHCMNKVPINQACNTTRICMDGLICQNHTCIAPQTAGQECDPEARFNPLKNLRCNESLVCSRGVCINKYSLQVDQYCSSSEDCETSYCDPVLKRCTRRRLCSGHASGCTCVCNSGLQNLGQCIMDNCQKQRKALYDCLRTQNYTVGSESSIPSSSVLSIMIDSQSSFYSKCQDAHQSYVRCQAIMHKWGAPAVGLGDFIHYDMNVSASSSVTVSVMAVVVFILSAVMFL